MPDDVPRSTVSVVIPVKDDADDLRRCLRALALQSRLPDEIVVVDNGSTDGSAQTARDAGARVVPCGAPGIPAASATGYDAATGDLILRLDADCTPARTWVESVERTFAERPDVGAVTGGARFTDGPRSLRRPLAAVYLTSYAASTAPALGHRPLFGSNLALRRSAWRSIRTQVHRSDPGLHDDLDLAFHVGERYAIGYLRDSPMGISMRPFTQPRGFAKRIDRGFRTVVRHWPADFPPIRWTRRALRLARQAPARRPRR
nr:glycosyltransferase family 2 protein [Microbacterium lemovicicum]